MTDVTHAEERTVETVSYACLRHPDLAIVDVVGKGRGVVATRAITEGTLLEVSPAIRLTKEETALIAKTALDTYVFDWQEPNYDSAVLLGVVLLVNHSAKPNAKFERDFTKQAMQLIAIRDINQMQEITINYNCELWFEVTD